MKTFEIDVSGSDIFEKDFTIVVAEENNSNVILAYKFTEQISRVILSRHGQNLYRYPPSKNGKANLKVRLYCVAIHYIFKELKKRLKLTDACLLVCRDFSGHEPDIQQSLAHLLEEALHIQLEIVFTRLQKGSIADRYAFLIRKDTHNKFTKMRILISLEEFEIFMQKK
ncbi:MAG: hypothetical protein PHH08_03585 [Candidatus ainarchaeum sp.]|nr:hypothetical protein [Candidatus ainarchaeum sp.]